MEKDRRREMGVKINGEPTIAGLILQPCNASILDSNKRLGAAYNDWNHDSYKSIEGANVGSYYHFHDAIGTYTVAPYAGYNDWRIPSKDELYAIAKTTRPGSSVNGVGNYHWACIRLNSSVTHCGTTSPYGFIIFPDYADIIASREFYCDGGFYGNEEVTLAQLNEYLSQGCAFLPDSGSPFSGWSWGGALGMYDSNDWADSERSKSYTLDLYPENGFAETQNGMWTGACIRLVRTYKPTSSPIYTLNNYVCNGTPSTAINTGYRIFNRTDFPNGFRIEFYGECLQDWSQITANYCTWFGSAYESGDPYQGLIIRQNTDSGDENKLSLDTRISSSRLYTSKVSCYSGTRVRVVATYDRSAITYRINDVVNTYYGTISAHNFPLAIGGALQTTSSFFSDRYSKFKVISFKLYKL